LFRRPKLTLSCSAEGKEGTKEGRKKGGEDCNNFKDAAWGWGETVFSLYCVKVKFSVIVYCTDVVRSM
jgi:hypothetical protein